MSKASKLARMKNNVPAVSQKILTRANRFVNHYPSRAGNTSTPLIGNLYGDPDPSAVANGNDVFWLVEEAIGSKVNETSTTSMVPGNKMLIDDLTLKSTTSKVKLSVSCYIDTGHSNAGPGFLIQRSRDKGNTWETLSQAQQFSVARNLVTFASQHGNGIDGFGPSLINIIDESPNTLTPQYRVLVHVTINNHLLLNREWTEDNSGYGEGTDATDRETCMRTVSVFSATEIINY